MNGGAIYATNNLYVGGRVIFQNNFANYSGNTSHLFTNSKGGAVYIFSGRFSQLYDSDEAEFLNNAAGDTGGAVSLLNSDMTVRKIDLIHSNNSSKGLILILKIRQTTEELFTLKVRMCKLSRFLFE